MATCSNILVWETPWTEEPGELQSIGVAKSRTRLNDILSRYQRDILHGEYSNTFKVI